MVERDEGQTVYLPRGPLSPGLRSDASSSAQAQGLLFPSRIAPAGIACSSGHCCWGAIGTEFYGNNDAGDIVGAYEDGGEDRRHHGLVRSGGKYIPFDYPGALER